MQKINFVLGLFLLFGRYLWSTTKQKYSSNSSKMYNPKQSPVMVFCRLTTVTNSFGQKVLLGQHFHKQELREFLKRSNSYIVRQVFICRGCLQELLVLEWEQECSLIHTNSSAAQASQASPQIPPARQPDMKVEVKSKIKKTKGSFLFRSVYLPHCSGKHFSLRTLSDYL